MKAVAGLLLLGALGWADAAQACVPWRPKVYFAPGEVRALDEQAHILDGVASTLQRNPEAVLVLISHTETRMERAASQDLAEKRAGQISDALVGRGVDAGRVRIRAEGSAGMRESTDVPMSNYVWLIFADREGRPLTCTGT